MALSHYTFQMFTLIFFIMVICLFFHFQWLNNCKATFPRSSEGTVVTCQPVEHEEKVAIHFYQSTDTNVKSILMWCTGWLHWPTKWLHDSKKKPNLFSLLEENTLATNFNWPLNTVPHALRLLCATVALWVLPPILWKASCCRTSHPSISSQRTSSLRSPLQPREPVSPDLHFI